MNEWEDDIKAMLSGNWRPRLVGGFSVTCRSGSGIVLMYPPQGIYATWRGVFAERETGFRVTVHGRTPGDTLSALREAVEGKGRAFGVRPLENCND